MEADTAQLAQSTSRYSGPPEAVPAQLEASEHSDNLASAPARSEFFQAATMGLVSVQEDLAEVALTQPEDRAVLRRFIAAAEDHAQTRGIADAWSVSDVAAEAEVELHMINRDSALHIALWVAWLQVTARFLPQEELRYQTLEEFMENYPVFADYEEAEQERLWHTANWMNYLFGQIPAKKNKGLAIQITPKLVEGWHARYVTGSGQTKQTADRVHVYEVEGEIQPYQRVKMNKRKRPAKKVEPKPKKTALGAQETSRPRMEGVEYDEDAERSPTATATAALSPAPTAGVAAPVTSAPMFEATKYPAAQQYPQQQHAPPQQQQQQQQRQQRQHRQRRLPSGDTSYYDNDTSSESMDGDLESLTSPMAGVEHHPFGGPHMMPEPQLGPELMPAALARLPSWNPADNPPIPNGQPLAMPYQPQTSAPRLARLCSWGTTQPEPQIGDHTRSLQDLPAFPAARPNGYGVHNGDALFANDLGDGMDPLELFLNSNFDFDNTL